MISTFWQILIATIIVSLVSFAGIFTLFKKKEISGRALGLFVSFAAGTILSVVFFDLIPEAFEMLGNLVWVLVGVVLFFVIESFMHWHHHGEDYAKHKHQIKPVVFLNLAGDAIHNFVDGVLIAASFLVSTATGIATTLAMGLHEIPQEIADYVILVRGGLSKGRAILFNFISAALAILGGITGYFFLTSIGSLLPYFISLAAGGFLYIATTDILPEIHKERRSYKRIILELIVFLIGVLMIGLIIGLFPE